MNEGDWVEELPAEVMVCDREGVILAMNAAAEGFFAEDGGRSLLGSDLLACHPEPYRSKLKDMLTIPAANSYLSTEKGATRFFHQSPWFQSGEFAGCVEISFTVPAELPHFIREK